MRRRIDVRWRLRPEDFSRMSNEQLTIARAVLRLLKPGGWFGCEHADVQGESAPAVFTSTTLFTEIRDQQDLSGRPRFTTGRRI